MQLKTPISLPLNTNQPLGTSDQHHQEQQVSPVLAVLSSEHPTIEEQQYVEGQRFLGVKLQTPISLPLNTNKPLGTSDQHHQEQPVSPVTVVLSLAPKVTEVQQPASGQILQATDPLALALAQAPHQNAQPDSPAPDELDLEPSTTQQQKPVQQLDISDEVVLPLPLPSPNSPTELQQIREWHQQNLNLLLIHPTDVLEWYQKIYTACEEYLSENPSSFKTSYLIRDILFELQHKTDLDIIRAYMRLCPNPDKDIHILLLLKPNIPLIDEPFDEINALQDAPAELKPLYAQYKKLKINYPVEGALLLQAIQSLRIAKVMLSEPNSTISAKDIPSISQDPRYEALKRHRGFIKVLEAIEDFFRLIIGKITGQPEFEYNKRPCFFKTKSAQLVEDADLIIQSDLQPI